MENLINTSKRYNRKFSLLYIDVDNFKSINDTQGHDAGDILIRYIADQLSKSCREVDFIARIGGDEFCMVAENLVDVGDIAYLAQRCCDAISRPVTIENIEHIPTCSIGISSFPDNGKSISTLLKAADTALYSAKESGKNGFLS